MKPFYDLLANAYRTRDRHQIPHILAYFHEDCFVIGTGLSEIAKGKKALETLLREDFLYWVDISFLKMEQLPSKGGFDLYRFDAEAAYRFHESEKTYLRYLRAVRNMKENGKPPYQKAVKALWMLDHLLASKPKKIRRYQKKLTVFLLVKDQKIFGIEYSFGFDKNHVDAIEGLEEDLDRQYAEQVSALANDEGLSLDIMRTLQPEGNTMSEVHVERVGSLFFGCGKALLQSSMDVEIMKDFEVIDQPLSSYQKLYQVRKKLGETLRIYAPQDKPKIILRFWGILDENRVIYIHHSYPLYFILED